MKYISLIFVLFCLPELSPARVLVEEDFEDGLLAARGWTDIAKWGVDRSLSIVGMPEVKPISGRKCLKIRYAEGDTGGWMHIRFPKEVREVYCRYYRLFPADWEWPKGYGPHDSIVFAGSYGTPTDTDLSVYLDFWKTGETFVRGATARQKWGYGGYSQVLRKHGGVANRLPYNVSRADLVKPDQWHCVEYCSKLSEPGQVNGQLRLWVNGRLVSEILALPMVDEKHADIQFNHWMLGPYFHGGSHRTQHNYLDALVISTEYIGTFEQKGNQHPRARFEYSRGWQSMTAEFDGRKSSDPEGNALRYQWDFGDGQKGPGSTVSHSYMAEGSYKVVLTVSDDTGQTHSKELNLRVGRQIGSGAGLLGEYWGGESIQGLPVVSQVTEQIDFQRRGWEGRFLIGNVGDNNGDNYSCRWTGYLQPTHSESYTLIFEVNDGGRVWFDGKLVIDAWDRPQTASASVGNLIAGKKYPIRIEHHKGNHESTKDFRARLFWQSVSTDRQIIPPGQFYPP